MEKAVVDGKMLRSLGLRHVFALSTGAMVSSGLFLLPGLAVQKGGPSAILAYAIAGLLVVPAMLAVSELATAMPRAGGAYYFLERAMGPAVGTVAGAGTWLSLVLKDAFAAVGMSAYLNIVVDVPAKPLALALVAVFTVLNLVGSKSSASVQLVLVGFVLTVMTIFLIRGLTDLSGGDGALEPFFDDGLHGLIAVIGLVFVSYGGLNTVASVAEEIEDPSRTIPLGMALSLLASTTLYTLVVLVTVAVVPAGKLHEDLAPIHSAAEAVLPPAGAVLVIIAALAAFSSAVNSGILSASRYPLAMSRDGLLPPVFQKLTPSKAPFVGVLTTGAAMAVVVMAFDAGAIAKLASAFVLLTLGLVNLNRARYETASALDMPFEDGSFDKAVQLHVGMNIADKSALFREVHRVLRPGGRFGVYDMMSVADGMIEFPVPWATDESMSFVEDLSTYRDALESAGFEIVELRNRRQFAVDFFGAMRAKTAAAGGPPPLGLHLILGKDAPTKLVNMVDGIAAGTIAPVEMICQKTKA